jgi:hypothetical protein
VALAVHQPQGHLRTTTPPADSASGPSTPSCRRSCAVTVNSTAGLPIAGRSQVQAYRVDHTEHGKLHMGHNTRKAGPRPQ